MHYFRVNRLVFYAPLISVIATERDIRPGENQNYLFWSDGWNVVVSATSPKQSTWILFCTPVNSAAKNIKYARLFFFFFFFFLGGGEGEGKGRRRGGGGMGGTW